MTTSVDAARPPRETYPDVLRVGATFGVVLLHVSAVYWYSWPVHSRSWLAVTITDSFVPWCVPVFFMLTGALYLGRARPPGVRRLFTHSLPRLVTALGVWGTSYAVFSLVTQHKPVTLRRVLTSLPVTYYHLWFLPAIIAIYLILPGLWLICRDRGVVRYLVALALVLFAAADLGTYLQLGTMKRAADAFEPELLARYVIFVLAGYLIATTRRRPSPWLLLMGAVLGTATTLALTVSASWGKGAPVTTWLGYTTTPVIGTALCVFALAWRLGPVLDERLAANAMLGFLSRYSFGVYLVHPAFLYLATVRLGADSVPVLMLLVWPGILLVSYASAFLVRNLPRVGGYLA